MKRQSRILASIGLPLFLASASFAQQVNTYGTAATLSGVNAASESSVRRADDFVPMTRSERAAHYLHALFGSEAFVLSAARAGVGQLRNSPHEWGQGAEGFGSRYGSAYAQRIIGQTIENGLALGLNEDNRYFRSGKHGIGRLGYAVTSVFLARHYDGTRYISFSAIGGAAGSAFISRAWQPRSISSMGSGARSFGIGMGVRVGLNIGREFLPNWIGKFLQ
jgi:hypothetical protein